MAIETVAELAAELRRHGLLEPAQADELCALAESADDPQTMARELVKRAWLTPHQANRLIQGNGHELRLGPYVLLERLGEGGMGQVFKARHARLGRVVALKLVRKDRLASAEAVQRFRREIRAAAQLKHPNIVHAYDADEIDGTHFLVMEYVAGTDLARRMREDGSLPIAHACEYIRQAALGLQHAHERGMVHRDIKPANLLVTGSPLVADGRQDGASSSALDNLPPGTVKILDMGLALLAPLHAVSDGTSTVTQEGTMMGTPDYMAPEQAVDSHAVDLRTDLYSLGCTFYLLLTGRVPFPGGSLGEKLMKHQLREPRPVEELRPEVSSEVAALVRKLMAKRPEDRIQTAGDLATALTALGTLGDGALSTQSLDATRVVERSATAPAEAVRARNDQPSASVSPWPDGSQVFREAVQSRRAALIGSDSLPWKMVVAAGAAVAVIVGVIVAGYWLSRPPANQPGPDPPLVRTRPAPKPLTVPPKPEPDPAWIAQVAALPPEPQVEAVKARLKKLNPDFDGDLKATIDRGAVRAVTIFTYDVTDISPLGVFKGLHTLSAVGSTNRKGKLKDLGPLRELKLQLFNCAYTQVEDLSPLTGMPLRMVNVTATLVEDLTPLKGANLHYLTCDLSKVTDLTPVAGQPLLGVWCNSTGVSDLTPVRGDQLLRLDCSNTKVADLSPLAGLKLQTLRCATALAVDFGPLRGLPLTELHWHFNPWRDGELFDALPRLQHINNKPVADFRADLAAKREAFERWVQSVRALPPEQQTPAVAAELRKRHPRVKGEVRRVVEARAVKSLELYADEITDLSPVRALPGLERLTCRGSDRDNGKLADLWPLHGLALTHLDCSATQVADLRPLRQMPLVELSCQNTRVLDLTPLKALPLERVHCDFFPERDAAILRGLKHLKQLNGRPSADVLK
jgi:serine/threonine-protein kinase